MGCVPPQPTEFVSARQIFEAPKLFHILDVSCVGIELPQPIKQPPQGGFFVGARHDLNLNIFCGKYRAPL